MGKTYFIMKNKYTMTLPPEFINSKNQRFIEVRQCKALVQNADNQIGGLVGDLELHSDLIKRDYYADHFILYCNEPPPGEKPMKYAWESTDKEVTIWFTDMAGTVVEPKYFTVIMLLTF